MNILAAMSWFQFFLAFLLIGISLLLMLIILLQRGRGGGLAGAFGGAGGSSAFGAKTGDVFTWITVGGIAVFVLLAVVSNYAFDWSPLPDAIPVATTTTTPAAPTPSAPVQGQGTPVKGQPIKVDFVPPTPAGSGQQGQPAEGTAAPAPTDTAPPAQSDKPSDAEPAEKPEGGGGAGRSASRGSDVFKADA